MKKGVFITLILGIMASGLCWWQLHHAKNHRRANVVEFESDMTERLLRGIFQELDTGNPPVYFVAFGEARTQPSRAFMERFADHVPPVQVFTSSVSTPNGLVLETDNGRAGVIIQIISFHEFSPGAFDVLVALSQRPARHDRFTYRLFNIGGDWKITSRKPA